MPGSGGWRQGTLGGGGDPQTAQYLSRGSTRMHAGFFFSIDYRVDTCKSAASFRWGNSMEKVPEHLKHAALTERIIKIFYRVYNESGSGFLRRSMKTRWPLR